MGRMIYDSTGNAVDVDDRPLAHMQIVIGNKLRRGESFFFSWSSDVSLGSGRNSIWLNPTIPLVFKYNGGRKVNINQRWLEGLTKLANSPAGLHVTVEPDPYESGRATDTDAVTTS